MHEKPVQQAREIEAQLAWLRHGARRLGYGDVDELLRRRPEIFDALAARWRRRHQRLGP